MQLEHFCRSFTNVLKFIISLAVSAVPGPYYFVYRMYQYIQLSRHLKNCRESCKTRQERKV